jgi:hypothetical protein
MIRYNANATNKIEFPHRTQIKEVSELILSNAPSYRVTGY